MTESIPQFCALPEALKGVSAEIGRQLASRGFRSWVVGGAVRDLALGRNPNEVDLATDATPDEVEATFDGTVPLGKRFGTVLVKWGGQGVEVTSLRAESGYTDARRPDEVEFGTSVEVDASRRDFTCNAMYLDTQSGEFLDPVHGLADARARVLRAVGEASVRFAEDGLRIMRLARLAATLSLLPDEATVAGARSSRSSLRGVSGERVFAELERGFLDASGALMLKYLADLGVHDQIFPHGLESAGRDAADLSEQWPGELGLLGGLLLIADPDPRGRQLTTRRARGDQAFAALESLRPSRIVRKEFTAAWRLSCELEESDMGSVDLAQQRIWMRDDAWLLGSALSLVGAGEALRARLLAWREERLGLSEAELNPKPWIDSVALTEAGVPPGPQWGVLLEEGLRLQLAGEWGDASEALRWLTSRIK